MPRHSFTTTMVALAAVAPSFIRAQTALADKRFTWDNLPYQADTGTGDRGTQFGFNLCNSTTENQESLCQTATINSLDDFCLWGPPEPNSLIGNTEGESVAWCTKPGRGTRLIPEGALTGVQFMKTPAYIQVTGFIKQELIYIAADDSGGELDPHGADQRGNPLGGLLFSNAWSGGDKTKFVQAVEWHNFMGGGVFCLKACDPSGADAANYCQHIYDRIGCQYNAPAAYVNGVFESCEGENQDFPGVYTGANGVVSTYAQPPESLGPITTIDYTARIPASSNCVTAQSTALYNNLPTATISTSATGTSGTATGHTTGTTSKATTTKSSGTGTSAASSSTASSGAAASSGVSFVTLAVGALMGMVVAF